MRRWPIAHALLAVASPSHYRRRGPGRRERLVAAAIAGEDEETIMDVRYEPTWESLRQKDPTPQWYKDAVLGFYFHWGPYSVPGFRCSGYWQMYVKDSKAYRLVKERYGEPGVEFGYKDFIPMWHAEKYDPDEWARLFKEAGADYAGPGAEHHDGFALWDTEFNEWNSVNMGPGIDIVGTLLDAVRRQGLKTCVAVHNWRTHLTYDTGRRLCPPGVDVNDPRYTGLYGAIHEPTHERPIDNDYPGADWPAEHWEERWNKWRELVDRYKMDLIWCEHMDSGEPPDELKRKMLAYYFNAAEEWGREVVVTSKKLRSTHRRDMPPYCTALNFEVGASPVPVPVKWQADIPFGSSWAYTPRVGCKPTGELIEIIADNVAKNGLTMFSVAPKPDGSLPEEQVGGLKELGRWMAVNKEALHGTVPAPFMEGGTDAWRSGPFRFTRKGVHLYAIALEKPKAPVTISDVWPLRGSRIRMLGCDDDLRWRVDRDRKELVIEDLPDPLPCDHAWSFKIQVLDESW